jgi:hypothetical protein
MTSSLVRLADMTQSAPETAAVGRIKTLEPTRKVPCTDLSTPSQRSCTPISTLCILSLTFSSVQMKLSTSLIVLSAAASVAAFPSFSAGHNENLARTLEMVRRDPELTELIRTLYAQQKRDAADFYADVEARAACAEESPLERRTGSTNSSANCLSHPLQDFYPTTVAGLKRFPEAAYPYQDPKPTDQRGPCPGLNALANHG